MEFDTYGRVRELAAQRAMSVSRLAAVCGLNPSTLAAARSRRGQLKLDTICCICGGLGISLAEFFSPPATEGVGPDRAALPSR